jgi:uncharacterized protein YecT (DUF1311 family)
MHRLLLATLLSCLPLAANAVDDQFRNYRPGLNTDVWFLGNSSFALWVKDYKSAARDGTKLVAGSSKIIFREGRMDAPDPIGCATAKYELKAVTAAELFGGKLANPEDDAKELGFDNRIVMLETGCPTKFYFVDPYKAVFAVADRIYTIEREPQAGAARPDDQERMEACLKLVADNRQARGAYTEPFLDEAPTAAARLEGVGKEARYLNSSCVGAIAYPCIAKHDDDATRNACYDRERVFWDERLNANYRRVLAKADPNVAASYKKIERAWLAWRDARCAHPQIELQGSMAGPMEAACRMQTTADQALWMSEEE